MTKVDVRKNVLAENQRAAEALRQQFARCGTLVVNLISSPGSGKTTLLERTISLLVGKYRLSALEGDIATERDAERLRRMGIPARQILTGGACHLDARLVEKEIGDLGRSEILFIENVGNLICPTSYDLGEDAKVVLLSVAEGDDKPFKYPGIFTRAAATVITKLDLLPYCEFDLDAVREQVSTLNPNAQLFLTSARTGEGLPDWCGWLTDRLETKRSVANPE